MKADTVEKRKPMDIHNALKQLYGFDSFRPRQEEIITSLMAGRDVFAVMPTGGGKSLCFQLPAHLLPGTALVISPLISLMKDQVDAALSNGLHAACLHSGLTLDSAREVYRSLRGGRLDLLYIAPERLAVDSFVAELRGMALSLIAIDEAHCVSEWGHDFRPDYLALSRLVEQFPGVPVAAFTATATVQVQEDIVARLGLRNPLYVRASFDRPNLFYAISPKTDVETQIREYVTARPGESGIVYRFSRKAVETTCRQLQAHGIAALPYHAGMEDDDRTRNQEAFRRDEASVIVATIAFGMGIDKPNVRWIVHGDLPKNVESYYQETGRAGRDGDPAHCQLFFSIGDVAKLQYFINEVSDVDERDRLSRLLQAVIGFVRNNLCRRKGLLGYFGEEYPDSACDSCDVCRGEVQTVDATVDAQKLMSAVVRTGQRYGAGHVVDVVSGADTQGIRRAGHDSLPTYGVGSDQPKKHWRRIVDELIGQGCLLRTGDRFVTLSVTEKGWNVLRGEKSFRMLTEARSKRKISVPLDGDLTNPELFSALRRWRRQRAENDGVPPYVVFGDRSLRAISAAEPTSEAELLVLHGIGEHKLRKYGEDVLAIVRQHTTVSSLANT